MRRSFRLLKHFFITVCCVAILAPVAFGAYKDIVYPGADITCPMALSPDNEFVIGSTGLGVAGGDIINFLYDNRADAFTPLVHSSGNTVPFGVNSSGQVVGTVDSERGYMFNSASGTWAFFNQPFAVWQPGDWEHAMDINDSGTIVGYYYYNTPRPQGAFGYVYDGSTFNQIIYNQGGVTADATFANAIDNEGRICGAHFSYSDLLFHGFYYENGQFFSFDAVVPGKNITATMPMGINDAGQITGWYATEPHPGNTNIISFFWLNAVGGFIYDIESGDCKDVPWPDPTANFMMATDIDNANKVLGAYGYADPTGNLETGKGFITDDFVDCIEEDDGALDVVGQSLCSGATIDVPIRIQNEYKPPSPPEEPEGNSVQNFRFEITYDPAVLAFEAVVPDGVTLLNFEGDYNEVEPGRIIFGAFSVDREIAADASVELCRVRFTVLADTETMIDIDELTMTDDFDGWSTSGACLSGPVLPEWGLPGDLNYSGEVTPLDAGCAGQEYVDICPTMDCGSCDSFECDVNLDCDCSAADVMCILNRSIKKPSCIDLEIEGSWSGTVPPDNNIVVDVNTDRFSTFFEGSLVSRGNFVNYSNYYNHAIVQITVDPDPANIGLYQKTEWVLVGGSLTLVNYDPHSTVQGAIDETTAGDPILLTLMP